MCHLVKSADLFSPDCQKEPSVVLVVSLPTLLVFLPCIFVCIRPLSLYRTVKLSSCQDMHLMKSLLLARSLHLAIRFRDSYRKIARLPLSHHIAFYKEQNCSSLDFILDALHSSGIMNREKDQGDSMTTYTSFSMLMAMRSRRNPCGELPLSSVT